MDKYKKKKDSYNLVFAILWGLLFVYWFTTAIYNVSMKSYITTLNKAIEYTDMIKPKELEFKKIKNPNFRFWLIIVCQTSTRSIS